MRKFLLLFSLLLMVIIGCNMMGDSTGPVMDTSNLQSQDFEIDTERDTIIMASNGTVLRIPAGTLVAANGKRATLEVKEALTIADMILGGLTTMAGDEALASGGMLFVNGKEGSQLKGKIEISLPSTHISSKMQLYKGVETSERKVDWQNPQPLPQSAASATIAAIDEGRIAFAQKCASCHAIGKDGKAPNLAHFPRRFPQEGEWIYYQHYGSVTNNDMNRGHFLDHYYGPALYKCNLQSQYSTVGPEYNSKGDATDPVIGLVFKYIQTESDRLNLPLPKQEILMDCIDSCKIYLRKKLALESAVTKSKGEIENLISENGPLVVEKRSFDVPPVVVQNNPQFIQGLVSVQNPTSTYYQFNIESFGWYNIDMLYKDLDQLTESNLRVKLVDGNDDFSIYLIIPSHKILQPAGHLKAEGEYGFYDQNGNLPLPANTTAFILAVQDGKDNPRYSLQRLDIGETGINEYVELTTREVTKEGFNNLMTNLAWENLKISVSNAKNADSIRTREKELDKLEIDLKELEKIKPAGCNCDCLDTPTRPGSYEAADTTR